MTLEAGVPSFVCNPARGLGEGAIVFVFDDSSKSMALDKDGEKTEIGDSWWATGGDEESIYEKAYKGWRKEITSSDIGRDDYAVSQLPESLTSKNASGFAIADGMVVSLERENGSAGSASGDLDGENSAPQKLRVINVSPLPCNFRSDIEFTTKSGYRFPSGVEDNKGVLKNLVFSRNYEKYPFVRIVEGKIIIPFADTEASPVDTEKQEEVEEGVSVEANPPNAAIGVAGVIRGIKAADDGNANGPYIKDGIIYVSNSSAKDMPFDVSLVTVTPVNNEDGGEGEGEVENEDAEPKTCLKINGGRVFLADAKYAIIPDKIPEANNPQSLLEVSSGYVMLSVYYDSSGTLKYRYSIESSPPGTAVTPQEETSESSSTEGEGGNESDG